MRGFLVSYSEHEQQMHIRNQDGGDRVLARRRELVDSATQTMVADEFYDGKPWVDLSEEEPMQGLKRFAGVDMQPTSDQDFCRQIFHVLNMDANVSVDSRVFMQKRAQRKYLAGSGLTTGTGHFGETKATVGGYPELSLPGLSYHIILARVTLYLADETTLHDMLGTAWLTIALRIHVARLK